MRCEELFKERSLWQKDAFDRIKASLLTARDNAFLQYDGMQESYLVVVYGPSQIGKTSLILKLIGIRDDNDCFQKVSQTLRTKEITRGNSSTSTAILYARSDTEQYALAVEDEPNKVSEKLFFSDEKELEAKLIEVRSRVVKNRESARSVLHIDIPRQFFTEETAAENLYVMDLPGVGSKTEGEAAHVQKLMRRYLPVAQVCLVVCTANTIQSLEVQDGLEPYWRDKPGQYIVAATKAFSLGTVKDYFKKPRQQREKSFYDFVMETYKTETGKYLGGTSKVEVFPVELADSFQKLYESLEEEDRKEMTETRDRILQELRQSIQQREGQRFQTALQRLQEELKTAEKSRLAENDGQLDKKKKEIEVENDIIKQSEDFIKRETTGDKQTEREERLWKIKGLQAAKDKLTAQNETLENSLTSHLETLQDALCGSLAENTALLTEQSDADQKAVLERVAALEQQLLTAVGNSSTQMTEYHAGIQETLTAQSETLETSLTSHLGTLKNALCGSLAENTAQLTRQNDADQKAVLESVAALEQQLLTALGDSGTQMTEYRDEAKAELVEYQKTQQQFAVQKYKLLLGTSLAFGIVNFLGIALLLYLNFMP